MKTLDGIVVSSKPKTVIVEVVRKITHPLYKKVFKRDRRFKADSAEFSVSFGDMVRIGECRHLSKDKNFKVIAILKKGAVDVVVPEEKEEKETQKKNSSRKADLVSKKDEKDKRNEEKKKRRKMKKKEESK
ncbi:MAG: 30S ribosomal protein S17 [bacterium]|nr:30S ribosomal protein S17 [bacterium]